MYPGRHQKDALLSVFATLLVFAPAGIAQPATSSGSQSQQSSADETTTQSQSQSTSAGTSDLTSPAAELPKQYTNNSIGEPLKAPQHHQHDLGAEKTSDGSFQSSLKGHVRKFQQYQTIPEGAFTQQQSPTQQIQQNAVAPDYSGATGQPQRPQFQTQNGYLQRQVPYPDQYAPYAVPAPGYYDPNQYQRYVQPVPSSINQNRLPRAIPWRFFGGCF